MLHVRFLINTNANFSSLTYSIGDGSSNVEVEGTAEGPVGHLSQQLSVDASQNVSKIAVFVRSLSSEA